MRHEKVKTSTGKQVVEDFPKISRIAFRHVSHFSIARAISPFVLFCPYEQNLGLVCTYFEYLLDFVGVCAHSITFHIWFHMYANPKIYICYHSILHERIGLNVDVFRNASCQGTGPLGPPTCNNTNPMNLGLTTLKLHDTWLTRLRVLPVTTFCHKLWLVKHCRHLLLTRY